MPKSSDGLKPKRKPGRPKKEKSDVLHAPLISKALRKKFDEEHGSKLDVVKGETKDPDCEKWALLESYLIEIRDELKTLNAQIADVRNNRAQFYVRDKG